MKKKRCWDFCLEMRQSYNSTLSPGSRSGGEGSSRRAWRSSPVVERVPVRGSVFGPLRVGLTRRRPCSPGCWGGLWKGPWRPLGPRHPCAQPPVGGRLLGPSLGLRWPSHGGQNPHSHRPPQVPRTPASVTRVVGEVGPYELAIATAQTRSCLGSLAGFTRSPAFELWGRGGASGPGLPEGAASGWGPQQGGHRPVLGDFSPCPPHGTSLHCSVCDFHRRWSGPSEPVWPCPAARPPRVGRGSERLPARPWEFQSLRMPRPLPRFLASEQPGLARPRLTPPTVRRQSRLSGRPSTGCVGASPPGTELAR